MKQCLLLITLLIFPHLAQAAQMSSPVLMLIHWVYETTYVIAALVVLCGIGLLLQHCKNKPKESA